MPLQIQSNRVSFSLISAAWVPYFLLAADPPSEVSKEELRTQTCEGCAAQQSLPYHKACAQEIHSREREKLADQGLVVTRASRLSISPPFFLTGRWRPAKALRASRRATLAHKEFHNSNSC